MSAPLWVPYMTFSRLVEQILHLFYHHIWNNNLLSSVHWKQDSASSERIWLEGHLSPPAKRGVDAWWWVLAMRHSVRQSGQPVQGINPQIPSSLPHSAYKFHIFCNVTPLCLKLNLSLHILYRVVECVHEYVHSVETSSQLYIANILWATGKKSSYNILHLFTDLYVKLYVINISTQKRVFKKKTRICRHDREPSFNETFRFSLSPAGHSLQVILCTISEFMSGTSLNFVRQFSSG